MNPYNTAYTKQYQNNQILTSSPEQILLLLYDGAIRFCRQAIAACEAGKGEEKQGRIGKTSAIIDTFSESLNHDIGGEIAIDLERLYDFMLRQLSEARREDSCDKLKVVENLLLDLRATWGEAVEINKKEQGVVAQQRETDAEMAMPLPRLSVAG
jgi:flagellar protein FliS